jgi:predicted amidohydrolase
MAKYDLLLKGARVADYLLGVDGAYDVAVAGGKVAAVEPEISVDEADKVVYLQGKTVLPGIVDLHTHISDPNGFRMLARAGVTTALDCGGPMDDFLEQAKKQETGINAAVIQQIKPGSTVSSDDPGCDEFRDVLHKWVSEGALGLKLLGGHYPLTPEATARAIQVCNEEKAYVCFHIGTKATGAGTLRSFREAMGLVDKNHLHLAHVNSYCRGQVLGDPVAETLEVIASLNNNRNLMGEAYLSVFSGSPGKIVNGELESLGPKNSLSMAGYGGTEEEMKRAILEGFAGVVAAKGDDNVVLKGEEAYEYWRAMGTDTTCTFPVTPGSTRFLLATAKDETGRFVVDAISTDGGAIPRNFIVSKGLSLVHLDAMTLREFTAKTSYFPAQILGLSKKGSLTPGFDADITVVDLEARRPVMSFVQGDPVMVDGVVMRKAPRIITTARGAKALQDKGFLTYETSVADSWFYRGRK